MRKSKDINSSLSVAGIAMFRLPVPGIVKRNPTGVDPSLSAGTDIAGIPSVPSSAGGSRGSDVAPKVGVHVGEGGAAGAGAAARHRPVIGVGNGGNAIAIVVITGC